MASHLDRWEKDPFFPAAEEVQQSADRMESTYRTLIHASKEPSAWNSEALRRDLRTALGTTKWQLEEFEKAVTSSYTKTSTEDTKDRHRDFITAMESQISKVENSCNDSVSSVGKPPRPWVRLDEGERKELAAFLSGSSTSTTTTTPGEETPVKTGRRKQQRTEAFTTEVKRDNKFLGHRRAASAGADIGSWKINVDEDVSPRGKFQQRPRKIPSFSGLLNTLEEYSVSRLKWQKNGYKKLKVIDDQQRKEGGDDKSLETQPLTRVNERSNKSFPENCGYYNSVKRRIHRSQYYTLHSHHSQLIWILVIICLLVLAVIRLM